jgi:hypothetical protein
MLLESVTVASLRMRWRGRFLEVVQESFINKHRRRTSPKAVQESFITKHQRRTSPKVCHSSFKAKSANALAANARTVSRVCKF